MNPVEEFLQDKSAAVVGNVAAGAAKKAPGFLKSLLEGLRSGQSPWQEWVAWGLGSRVGGWGLGA